MKPVPFKDRLFVRLFQFFSSLSIRVTPDIAPDEIRKIDTHLGKTRLLIFRPEQPVKNPLPCCIDMHGGGFVAMTADYDDPFCRATARDVGCLVISIDYKLAPQYRFPMALEECYEVVKWVAEHAEELGIDRERIAVCGHSAGGNFAAGLCLLAKERREFPLCLQILDYPPMDLTRDPGTKTRVPAGSEKKVIPPNMARMFDACYIGSREDARNPLVSPVYAQEVSGLPPAVVITAECDSLAEEAEVYVEKLRAAGVEVNHRQFPGAVHGFTLYKGDPQAQEAWQMMHAGLRKAFG